VPAPARCRPPFPEKEDGIVQALALLARLRRMAVTTFPRWAEAGPDVVW